MSNMPAMTQDEVTYCGVHEDREATLRCIRCERYMCTECVVQTPVGYICRQCARKHDDKFFNASSVDDLLVFASTAVLTGIGAAIVSAINLPIFFLLILGLPLGGGIVAEAALRLTQKRRGRYSHYIGVAGTVIGGLVGAFLQAFITLSQIPNAAQIAERGGSSLFELALSSTVSSLSVWLFVLIIAAAVYGRYKMRV